MCDCGASADKLMAIQIPGYVTPGQALCPAYEAFESRTVRRFIAGPGTKYDSISIGNNDRAPVISSTILGKVRMQRLGDGVGEPLGTEENSDRNKESRSSGNACSK